MHALDAGAEREGEGVGLRDLVKKLDKSALIWRKNAVMWPSMG